MKSANILLSIVAAVAITFGFSTSSVQGQCTTDTSGDGQVGGEDLAPFLADWGLTGSTIATDFNHDGVVDGLDLPLLLGSFGPCPAPTWATVLEWSPDVAVVTDANLRAAIVASGFPWRIRDNSSNIEMLLVPAGTFTMGCSASTSYSCGSDESPLHQVTLTNAFYMGRYEVTQAQWTAKMGSNPSYFQGASYPDAANRPVERVSWNMIASGSTSFMGVTSLRLPTEAEWEYAYRAGTSTAFHRYPGQPTGFNTNSLLVNIAWYGANAGHKTHAVGGKFANALGLHDMSGNVWEWCQDWYGDYSSAAQTNPTGPATGLHRLSRGGGWSDISGDCRASRRLYYSPDYIYGYYGFRVVRSANTTLTAVTPSSGLVEGGTTITLTGENLTGATSVTVGGVAATSVVVVSSTSVTAVTPAGTAGAKNVVVTTPNGSATATNAFIYGSSVVVPAWATLLEPSPDAAVVTDTNLRTAIVASGFAWRIRDNSSNIEMLLVPAGTFTMGCSASTSYGCEADESPLHQVTLTNAFYMGRYEVTQAQWTAKMGSNPSYFVPANGYSSDTTKPVEQVSWNMIASGSTSFMGLTGLRLPTEAEWEYAYRAGTTTAFHSYPGQPTGFNDDSLLVNIAWYSAKAFSQTHAVGGKLANALGLHDMAGNVYEWCQDWYGSTYYASSPLTNPTGPTTGSSRLLRGGRWINVSDDCRASWRLYFTPGGLDIGVGFRVVRTP